MRCPSCGNELETDAKSCPSCNRLLVDSVRDRLYSHRTHSYSGVRHQQGRVKVDQDFNEEVKVTTESDEKIEADVDAQSKTIEDSFDDSEYADVLKPHYTIDVKGIGSKIAGPFHVTAVRHEIAASDESETSQRFRCLNCGSVNDKSDKFCRNCGTRIPS